MSKKGENIYKRKDGRWEGRYIKSRTPEGKALYGYVYAKSYREAKAKLIETAASHDSHPVSQSTAKEPELFRSIANAWLVSVQPQVKESTYNKYSNLLHSYILPCFGKIPLSDMTHEMIEYKCNELLLSGGTKKTGLSSKTVADVLSVIRSIFKFAVKNGITVSCDACSVQIKNQRKEMRVLTRREQEKLYRYLRTDPSGSNIGILVCMFTGLRIGEICALRWENISLSEQTIHVCQTMQRIQNIGGSGAKTKLVVTSPKSPSSVRTIPIPDELAQLLASYHTCSAGYLLTNDDVRCLEPRIMENRFKKALKKSGVEDANFHALRHTFATRCVEVGFDVKSLSEILGHSSVNITMNRYVHPSMELKKENMRRLSELFAVN